MVSPPICRTHCIWLMGDSKLLTKETNFQKTHTKHRHKVDEPQPPNRQTDPGETRGERRRSRQREGEGKKERRQENPTCTQAMEA